MDMLALTLSLLTSDHDALETELRALGARHRTYGVRDEYYGTVGRAMLDMLAEVLGREFTPVVGEAWANFYAFVAETMKSGAKNPNDEFRIPKEARMTKECRSQK